MVTFRIIAIQINHMLLQNEMQLIAEGMSRPTQLIAHRPFARLAAIDGVD